MVPLVDWSAVNWTAVGLIVAVVGSAAAVWQLVYARKQHETTKGDTEAAKPDVDVRGYIEKTPLRRVRVVLDNTGGSRVTVSTLEVVRQLGGSGHSQHEIIPTELVTADPDPGSERYGQLELKPNDEKKYVLRRPDGSKFEDPDKLRILAVIAGAGQQVVPLTEVDERFFVKGVDTMPPPPAPPPAGRGPSGPSGSGR